MDTIEVKELMLRSGATYRQINYWVTKGVIKPLGHPNPGNGFAREFDSDIPEKVRTLVLIQKVLSGRASLTLLKKIYDNHEDEYVELGEGITIHWNRERTRSGDPA